MKLSLTASIALVIFSAVASDAAAAPAAAADDVRRLRGGEKGEKRKNKNKPDPKGTKVKGGGRAKRTTTTGGLEDPEVVDPDGAVEGTLNPTPPTPAPTPAPTLAPTLAPTRAPTAAPTAPPTSPDDSEEIQVDSISGEECVRLDVLLAEDPPFTDSTNPGCARATEENPGSFTPVSFSDGGDEQAAQVAALTGTVGEAETTGTVGVETTFDDDWFVVDIDTDATFSLTFNEEGTVNAQVFAEGTETVADGIETPTGCPSVEALGSASSSVAFGEQVGISSSLDLSLTPGRYYIWLYAGEAGECIPYDVSVSLTPPVPDVE